MSILSLSSPYPCLLSHNARCICGGCDQSSSSSSAPTSSTSSKSSSSSAARPLATFAVLAGGSLSSSSSSSSKSSSSSSSSSSTGALEVLPFDATGATGLATGFAGGAFASEAGSVLRFLLAGGASICYQSMLSKSIMLLMRNKGWK